MIKPRREFLIELAEWYAAVNALPVFVSLIGEEAAAQIRSPLFKQPAIGPKGTLWAWGQNNQGQLGLADVTSRSSPVQVIGSSGSWVLVSAHGDDITTNEVQSAFMRSDGTIWGCGFNNQGHLGQNNRTPVSTPVQYQGSAAPYKTFITGGSSILAIGLDARMWVCGYNGEGSLGVGDQTHRSSPVQLAGSWAQVAAGDDHSLGIRTNGEAWVWGRNQNGNLGIGSSGLGNRRTSPVQLTGTSWVSLYCGDEHSAGIQSDRTLWVWGAGTSGRLGNNATALVNSPVNVAGSWIHVDFTNAHSAGIREDYTLWTWGAGANGKLGNNGTANMSSPVQVPGSWVQVAAGRDNTYAIRTDATLWAWGSNTQGQIGNGTSGGSFSSPVNIPGSWIRITAGNTFALGVRTS